MNHESKPQQHDCQGINACLSHPRWHVVRYHGTPNWTVFPPAQLAVGFVDFPTQAEAFAYAHQEASR